MVVLLLQLVQHVLLDDDGVHGGAGFLNVHFFKSYEPGVSVGEMFVSSQNDYIEQREWPDTMTLHEFNLLGDPSLKVGGYPPSQNLDINIDSENLIGYEEIPLRLKASSNQNKKYTYSWDLDEDGKYDDEFGENVQWIWHSSGIYYVSLKAIDNNNIEQIYTATVFIGLKPDKPTVTVSSDESGDYIFNARYTGFEQSWNEIYYIFDWGDGTFSDILGPYNSYDSCETVHSWSKNGIYNVKVKTLLIDSQGYLIEETGWSDPQTISKEKNKTRFIHFPILEKLFTIFQYISNLIMNI